MKTPRWARTRTLLSTIFKLSIRRLMLLVLVIGCLLGWIIRQERVQRLAAKEIKDHGSFVVYDFESDGEGRASYSIRPRWFDWTLQHVGPDWVGHVVSVFVYGGSSKRAEQEGDTLLESIGKLPRLKCLTLLHATQVTDVGLRHIANLSMLEQLDLSYQGVQGPGLSHLKNLRNVKGLYLEHLPIKDIHLESLMGYRRLEWLKLTHTDITASSAHVISQFTNLTHLDLSETFVTDPIMAEIGKLVHLEYLNLRGTRITDAGVRSLLSLPNLKDLNLEGTGITDLGVGMLSQLKTLKEINISGTKATDESLKWLGSLPKCNSISFYDTTLTEAGAAAFRVEFPSKTLAGPRSPAHRRKFDPRERGDR